MEVEVRDFGTYNEIKYDEIFITNPSKFQISFSNLGARINSWQVPIDGELSHIILGYDNAGQVFATPDLFYGATIGRVAGRIREGHLKLSDRTYQLPINNGENHLHGGPNSLDVQKWDYEIKETEDQVDVIFTYEDKAGTNDYPGHLKMEVKYSITFDNKWTIHYRASTDETTVFNPTNHVYFNLNGNNSASIENHTIQVSADDYLSLNAANLPTGDKVRVEETVFDLRASKNLGEILEDSDEQIRLTDGLDHPFLLSNRPNAFQAMLTVPDESVKLFMKTSEPALVIYTHNSAGYDTEIWGNPLTKYAGITLETQKEPDAPNHDTFSSIVLNPGETFESETVYWIETK